MKKYVITVIIVFWGILLYFFTVHEIPVHELKYYGLMRYRMDRQIHFILVNKSVAIEPWVFSYYFESPYMYTYGVSGFTKTNVVPFGNIEKVINNFYYIDVPEEFIGPYRTTLLRLQNTMGNQLIIKNSLQEITVKDKQIYQQLYSKGEETRKRYFQMKQKMDASVADKEKQGLDELASEF